MEFGIIESLTPEMGRGFLFLLPVCVVMVAMTYYKVKNAAYHLTMNRDTVISFIIVLVSAYLLTFVHEIIHALFYPAGQVKEIWKSKEQGAYVFNYGLLRSFYLKKF